MDEKTVREMIASAFRRHKSQQHTHDHKHNRGPVVDTGNGVEGNKGPRGDKGPVGDQGPVGEQGVPGEAGEPGVEGDKGSTGDQGLVGDKGPQGDPGGPGDKGPEGDAGDRGLQGPVGEQGPPGQEGSQGDQGPVGDKGPSGDPGVAGDPGQTGGVGLPGDQGPVGDKGPQGDPGEQGPPGEPGTGGEGGSDAAALSFAKGAGLNVEQGLLAAAGQPAKTVLVCGATTSGKVQGCSLGNGNVVEVFASGADYNSKTVLYREFMSLGEPICFTGLNPGAVITSTQGFYGMGEQVIGGQESPMPLMSLGLAFTSTFLYAFRNSQNTNADTGQVIVCNGPLPSTVTFSKNGNEVNGQAPKELEPFELCYFYTNANGEYLLEATSPVMACVQARMGNAPPAEPQRAQDGASRFYDARLVMPLTNDGITWPRSGFVSAPYANTTSKYYVRDGATGNFPVINPGSPVDFDASGSTGANDADYEPRGATRMRVNGLISAYSGADSAGLEASPMIPTAAMSQIVAQPFFIDNAGDGGNSGVAIASPYKGTAKVYQWNAATGVADLVYTVPLERGTAGQGITPAAPEDQYFPAAGLVAREPGLTEPSVVQFSGDLGAGCVIADVPITVVAQNATPSYKPDVRSQNGTTTPSIITDDDETLMLGWTPDQLKAEITTGADSFTYRRVITGGVETWELT